MELIRFGILGMVHISVPSTEYKKNPLIWKDDLQLTFKIDEPDFKLLLFWL